MANILPKKLQKINFQEIYFLTIIFLIFLLSTETSVPNEHSRGQERNLNFFTDYAYDGASLNLDLNLNDRWQAHFGAIRGNPEISSLETSPFAGLSFYREKYLKYKIRNVMGLGFYYTNFLYRNFDNHISEEKNTYQENIMPVTSFYNYTGKRFRISKKIHLSSAIAISLANGAFYGLAPIITPEASPGAACHFLFFKKSQVTMGIASSYKLERSNVQNLNMRTWEGYFETSHAWTELLMKNIFFPFRILYNFEYSNRLSGHEILGEFMLLKGSFTELDFLLRYEVINSRHILFPQKNSMGAGFSIKHLASGFVFHSTFSREKIKYTFSPEKKDWLVSFSLKKSLGQINYGIGFEAHNRRSMKTKAPRFMNSDGQNKLTVADNVKIKSMDEFIRDHVENPQSPEALLDTLAALGDLLYDNTYNETLMYDPKVGFLYKNNLINTISGEEIYNTLRESLNTGSHVDGPICTGITKFIAQMVERSNIPEIKKVFITSVRVPLGPHEAVLLVTDKGIYIHNGDWYLATGTSNPELALSLYQKQRRTSWARHTIFDKGKYIGEIETPDNRLAKKNLTIQRNQSIHEILRSQISK